MAKTSGTQTNIGLGIEGLATPGTSVAETVYIPWQDFSFQDIVEKSHFTSARGLRNMSSNSMIRRRYSQGSISFVPNTTIMPYFLSMALGGVSSASVVDGTYTHTFTVQNTNTTVRTATLTIEEGAIQGRSYLNCVCNSLNFEVTDDYAKCTVELIGQYSTSDTFTESFAQATEFAYHQYTAKFGTSLTNADGASATPLKGFTLNINNNVLLDEAFLSGSADITDGNLVFGRLEVTGSYTLHFSDTTELAKYQANTKNAMVVEFIGAVVGGGSTTEKLSFRLGKLILTKPPVEYNLDGLLTLTQEFTVEYDATDLEISAKVTNTVNNASTRVYDKA